jgi:hypothetical protein
VVPIGEAVFIQFGADGWRAQVGRGRARVSDQIARQDHSSGSWEDEGMGEVVTEIECGAADADARGIFLRELGLDASKAGSAASRQSPRWEHCAPPT